MISQVRDKYFLTLVSKIIGVFIEVCENLLLITESDEKDYLYFQSFYSDLTKNSMFETS